jgi:predicted RNase H-like nuclease
MSRQPLKRGAPLPYKLLAGVEPCPGGWLVVTGKLQGITLFPEPPQVLGKLIEVLDYRPSFEVIAIHAPIGLPGERAPGGRACDREARRLLGRRRGTAIISPPPRSLLGDLEVDGLSAVARVLLPRIQEAHREIASYHQRLVYEVHPELGFYELNGGRPLRYGKRTTMGRDERLALLSDRIPGIERVLEFRPDTISLPSLLDACINLWTARRIAARAVTRLPEVPEWNQDGLRMELVR